MGFGRWWQVTSSRRPGDAELAMQFIGDTDLRVMNKYLKRRMDRLEAAAKDLDATMDGTQKVRADVERTMYA
jgi:hypothetical protein